jgi:hypothetical protein
MESLPLCQRIVLGATFAAALTVSACTGSSQGTKPASPSATLSAAAPSGAAAPVSSGALADPEVDGVIAAGSLAGSCAAHTLSFTVGSTRIVTNGSTRFSDSPCTSLKAGSVVEVKGTRQPDNSILATSVEASGQDDNEDGDQSGVKGVIAAGSLVGSCAASSLSFRIGSTTIRTNAQTRLDGTSCSALKAGDSVEVKGTRQADGSVLASRVERGSEDD